jgi:hypothetical protein
VEARSLDELDAEGQELAEAVDALTLATMRLQVAQDRLARAHGWGTYDTWFGGGLLSSLFKHDRIEDAEAMMRRLDLALQTVRTELADIGIESAGDVGVAPLSRTLDIWFDNIFSDLGTQRRIKDAQDRLTGLAAALDRADLEVRRRIVALEAQVASRTP